jgi:hypothetical protein
LEVFSQNDRSGSMNFGFVPNFRGALDAAIAVCLRAERQCRGASDRGC